VRIVLLFPTASNFVPDQVMPQRFVELPEVRDVHVTASGDVRIVPAAPTATNCDPDRVTP
jgi:hypothetical protein